MVVGCYVSVSFNAKGHTYDKVEDVPSHEYGLLLGTSPTTPQGAHNFTLTTASKQPWSCIEPERLRKSLRQVAIVGMMLKATLRESAVRLAIAYGGDADTQAAITGRIAAAYYGEIPDFILTECLNRLPLDIKEVIAKFNISYRNGLYSSYQR